MATERYKFPATLKALKVTTKRVKNEADETVEVPCLTITLEAVHDMAASGAAKLMAFQGLEIGMIFEGDPRPIKELRQLALDALS